MRRERDVGSDNVNSLHGRLGTRGPGGQEAPVVVEYLLVQGHRTDVYHLHIGICMERQGDYDDN